MALLALSAGRSLEASRGSFLAAGRSSRHSQAQLLDRAAIFQRHAYSTGLGVDFASLADDNTSTGGRKTVVWVTGFPRSGSSTVLSMVSVQSNKSVGGAFALFEPCHPGDKVGGKLKRTGCKGLLQDLSKCRFTRVKDLWGWKDPHTSGNHEDFDPEEAHRLCKKASRITFKTVDYGHNSAQWLPILNQQPDLHIIATVRDPRGIWASWKTLEPFATLVKEGNFYTMEEICRTYADNLVFEHPRVKRVSFERMVRHPTHVTSSVYKFLGLRYGAKQD